MGGQRISIVLPNLRGGGAERVSVDLARAFAECGHEVEFVLMTSSGDFLREVQRDFRVIDLGVTRLRNVLRPMYGYLRNKRPDAVIAMMWPLTTVVPLAARLARIQGSIMVCEHGILSRQYDEWGTAHRILVRLSTFFGYRLATARLGVSDGVVADMARLSAFRESKISTIYNPLRPMNYPSVEQKATVDPLWKADGPRILSVGKLKSVKNHAFLLHAFAALSHPRACLTIVGQGQTESMLRTLAVELGIEDRVLFAGFHEDPSPFYATANLFVLSSDHEGFGNVIVEALSFGLPVVSTNCPSGPAEILGNGCWGMLVPVGDVAALSDAMEEALNASVDHEALKRRAAEFSPEIAAQQYLDLLSLSCTKRSI
ncbi:glycosyl transferase [Solemya pervernicosa gill symbiont]|uniref:Glycosyl transferase n=1 Tax=Solemya pervernicosa gill symbiont TaxID=642797 RepID=A0A1T2L5L7_9GAMM|nr:glycosyltransferase [Solemya pervernicosa gill symbiont]OOZ40373.1 glycosyl transferase [Solemya pervernicosa gill symbiont]